MKWHLNMSTTTSAVQNLNTVLPILSHMPMERQVLKWAIFGSMPVEMPVEVSLHGSLVWTQWTWIGFLARVSADVPPQIAGINSLIATVWTGLWSPPFVNLKVPLELLWIICLTWTMWTGEGSIPTPRLTMAWVLGILAPCRLDSGVNSSTRHMSAALRHLWGIAGRSTLYKLTLYNSSQRITQIYNGRKESKTPYNYNR